jgi:hypothetical protein
MKPKAFFYLPSSLQETLLSEMDDLDYCHYESSHAECVHGILCGNASLTNKIYINDFYENLSVERLQLLAKQKKESLLSQIEELNEIIG